MKQGLSKRKLAFVTAVPITFHGFMKVHAGDLQDEFDITLITNTHGPGKPGEETGFPVLHAPIARQIAIGNDLRALWRLMRIFRAERFDIVHSITPKAGLLAMLAATLVGQGARVHSVTGQVWATRSGASRWLLKSIDRLTIALAQGVLADSRSQVEFLKEEGIDSGAVVLEHGSIAGVDPHFFHPSPVARASMRERHGLPDEALVVSYLGRLTRDKGVLDLVDAFGRADFGGQAALWLMGHDEEGLSAEIMARAQAAGADVTLLGPTQEHAQYLAASDIFCLPSYREGFGMTTLEAAACELPVIASDIPGLRDAVAFGETALAHPAGDVAALADCLTRLAQDAQLRRRLGAAGRARAVEKFDRRKITEAMRAFYRSL